MPVLEPILEPYWEAFQMLSYRRPAGFGVSAIPLSEINAYLDGYRITDPDQRQLYIRLLTAMDLKYLDWVSSKRKKPAQEVE